MAFAVLGFGKFRGRSIDDPLVDMGYLRWLAGLDWLWEWLRELVIQEINRRELCLVS
jgi:hypothetical protein